MIRQAEWGVSPQLGLVWGDVALIEESGGQAAWVLVTATAPLMGVALANASAPNTVRVFSAVIW